jgi:DHA1 family bicyclomycin/chloramphenicol resistance-like MFS transporter
VRLGIDRMLAFGAIVQVFGTGALALASWLGPLSLAGIFLPMTVVALSNGLVLPNGIAGAISVNPRMAGAAAGLSGALQMATGAIAAMLVGNAQDHDPSQYPMIWTMLACGILSLLVFVLAAKFRTSRP